MRTLDTNPVYHREEYRFGPYERVQIPTPDGFTLSIVSNNHVIYPSVYKSLPFDPIKDITPIAVIGSTPIVLVVNAAKIPAKNAQELIALLKAKPGVYNYGSSGNGTIEREPESVVPMYGNGSMRRLATGWDDGFCLAGAASFFGRPRLARSASAARSA